MTTRREEIVCAGIGDLAHSAAAEWVRRAAEAIAGAGRFTVALSGGNTPRALYAALAGSEFRSEIAWDHVHFFWGDERSVPADHPDSNYRMAYETLLSRVPVTQANIHRIETERGPEKAAAAYEAELRDFFALSPSVFPRFDLILLGIGEEGHTASLFPGSAALEERERLVIATYVEKLKTDRITFTLPLLNSAAEVAFLVSGKSKAGVVKEMLHDGADLPAARVAPTNGRLSWFLDKEAAALL
ncbi:MAG TPA: 6-phosphogluconolactonase [Candidatus Binatia bacterium]|jgi:6-phosphogluconolactonase